MNPTQEALLEALYDLLVPQESDVGAYAATHPQQNAARAARAAHDDEVRGRP